MASEPQLGVMHWARAAEEMLGLMLAGVVKEQGRCLQLWWEGRGVWTVRGDCSACGQYLCLSVGQSEDTEP